MSHKKHILPIFLLYFITSFLFLLLFINLYYASEEKLIRQNGEYKFAHIAKELNTLVKNDIDILNHEPHENVKIQIKDLNKNQVLVDEIGTFLELNKKLGNKKVSIINGELFLQTRINSRRMANSYELIILDTEYKPSMERLFIKSSVIFIVMFLAFLVIGYFIIRLSLRPLFDKIKTLNAFIEDATHEINTPLSVILMSVEMFDANPKKYLSNIKTASKTLSNLYNDLVSLSLKTEPNNLITLNLKEFLTNRLDFFSMFLNRKNLKFELNLSDVTLNTDVKKIEKILDNLISNAIKYSDENQTIKISLDKNSFEIENFGEEIKSENLKTIFDKFSRFSKNEAGFGIGLSIVKKYSDELGYKISCQSQNRLTKFRLKFN
ncbi:MAG: HAMP domain-containing histidine kinase [Campylobacteraceae bacterium]|nr:HAMP domain-containing histidine kinase [Campylobacteraceae bacterium]